MRELAQEHMDMILSLLPPQQFMLVLGDGLSRRQPQLKLVHHHRCEMGENDTS